MVLTEFSSDHEQRSSYDEVTSMSTFIQTQLRTMQEQGSENPLPLFLFSILRSLVVSTDSYVQ